MKKIYINARFLTQNITGVQRYATELVKSFDTLLDKGIINAEEYSFTLIAPRGSKKSIDLKHISIKSVGRLNGHFWEQLILPLYTHSALLINLCNTGPLFKRNQIVTIHDAAVFAKPEAYSKVFKIWYRFLLTGLGLISKKIGTDSSFSKNEIIKYCKVKEKKINIIYGGKEHLFLVSSEPSILKKHGLDERPFLLTVSSINSNKNFKSIMNAIKILGKTDYDIVIAGGTNHKIFNQDQFELPSTVKYLGYITDSELKTLYENATCFVFPSFYEGFGLPPLEAMACGCPVIVSNNASLPEVCGDAALYCNPHSPEDVANKIRILMNDGALRQSLQQKGLERAKQFTWEKCARETLVVIEKVLSE